MSPKTRRFWPVWMLIVLADALTKGIAERYLQPPGTSREILRDWVKLSLTYNRGGAMGISTGALGFQVLVVASVVMVAALMLYYWRLPDAARLRPAGVALVVGGALGNLLDRIFSQGGVVDFIDLGIGSLRFWTFNLADASITTGAVLMAWWFWMNDRTSPESGRAQERGGE